MRQISHLYHLPSFNLHQAAIFLTGFPLSKRKPGDGLQECTSCAPTCNESPVPGNQNGGSLM